MDYKKLISDYFKYEKVMFRIILLYMITQAWVSGYAFLVEYRNWKTNEAPLLLLILISACVGLFLVFVLIYLRYFFAYLECKKYIKKTDDPFLIGSVSTHYVNYTSILYKIGRIVLITMFVAHIVYLLFTIYYMFF